MRIALPVTPEQARARLEQLAREQHVGFAALSKLLGRNAAYVQQYVKRGSPRVLDEADCERLANFFGVDPAQLGGPPAQLPSDAVQVRKLDVRPSAGPGAATEQEQTLTHFLFDRRWLRDHGQGTPEKLSIVRVSGDSMAPTLQDGDELLVAPVEGNQRLHDGVYVLERDDALMVKRLAINPATSLVTIASDNPAYPTWHECDPRSVRVIGRVVWTGRWLG